MRQKLREVTRVGLVVDDNVTTICEIAKQFGSLFDAVNAAMTHHLIDSNHDLLVTIQADSEECEGYASLAREARETCRKLQERAGKLLARYVLGSRLLNVDEDLTTVSESFADTVREVEATAEEVTILRELADGMSEKMSRLKP